jgi:5-methylcytosine-specific restriction endonuclease McrA
MKPLILEGVETRWGGRAYHFNRLPTGRERARLARLAVPCAGCGTPILPRDLHPIRNKPTLEFCSEDCWLQSSMDGDDPWWRVDPAIRREPEHRHWRRTVLKRDGWQCRLCRSIRDLQVHHIVPLREEPEAAHDPDNGITLCACCHRRVGQRERQWEPKLQRLARARHTSKNA